MGPIYLIVETFLSGLSALSLVLLTISSILFGVFVIISKNPIVSVLFLIGLFVSIALYLIFIGVNFIGIAYLLVYVGAVSILFLFILMLINIRISELLSDSKNSILLVLLIGLFFTSTIIDIIPIQLISKYFDIIENTIFFTTLYYWESNIVWLDNILSIGSIMYTSYSIWLVLASVILLLAMVGAIVITIKDKDLYSSIISKEYNLTTLNSKVIPTIDLNQNLMDAPKSFNKDLINHAFKDPSQNLLDAPRSFNQDLINHAFKNPIKSTPSNESIQSSLDCIKNMQEKCNTFKPARCLTTDNVSEATDHVNNTLTLFHSYSQLIDYRHLEYISMMKLYVLIFVLLVSFFLPILTRAFDGLCNILMDIIRRLVRSIMLILNRVYPILLRKLNRNRNRILNRLIRRYRVIQRGSRVPPLVTRDRNILGRIAVRLRWYYVTWRLPVNFWTERYNVMSVRTSPNASYPLTVGELGIMVRVSGYNPTREQLATFYNSDGMNNYIDYLMSSRHIPWGLEPFNFSPEITRTERWLLPTHTRVLGILDSIRNQALINLQLQVENIALNIEQYDVLRNEMAVNHWVVYSNVDPYMFVTGGYWTADNSYVLSAEDVLLLLRELQSQQAFFLLYVEYLKAKIAFMIALERARRSTSWWF